MIRTAYVLLGRAVTAVTDATFPILPMPVDPIAEHFEELDGHFYLTAACMWSDDPRLPLEVSS